jgi:hypothetical protein
VAGKTDNTILGLRGGELRECGAELREGLKALPYAEQIGPVFLATFEADKRPKRIW